MSSCQGQYDFVVALSSVLSCCVLLFGFSVQINDDGENTEGDEHTNKQIGKDSLYPKYKMG